ncbi:aldo/keto reductase [Actinomyces glycerinitolerans]|uniref:Aldo/keto reductase n=1 Tax=Actinomyces glycerinitolerans TaxID=1892869 RepID=A0A1M4RXP2_9ACTO|nr:aldo/keto reductase [Actinomyces glycerinitolerans]SHE24477.1 aldo/keto reductase [Actinomyces glycerinitolerans]
MRIGDIAQDVSRIGLGTWAIGGGPAFGGVDTEQQGIATIQAAPSLGVNLVDTAPGYNFGRSEEIVGEAIAGHRDEYVLITKCGLVWDAPGAFFNRVGDTVLNRSLEPDSILREIDRSLERLDTDHIDIYMAHWPAIPPYNTPIADTVACLMDLKASGRIRAIGAANVNAEQVLEYLRYGQLDIVQMRYSILDRAVEQELMPTCIANGVTVQAYSPLEMGILAGAVPRGYQPEPGTARYGKKWFEQARLEQALDMVEAWEPLRNKYNCGTADLAIAWILAQNPHITVLSGSTKPEELAQNVRALSVELTDEDATWMREYAEQLG